MRVRRRAPKLLFPQDSVKNLKRRGRKLIFSAPCRVLISPYCFFKYAVIIYPVYPLYRTFVHVLPAESTTTVDPCGTCTSTRADFEPLLRRFTYVPCGWRTMRVELDELAEGMER